MQTYNSTEIQKYLDYCIADSIILLCYVAFCHENYTKERALVFRQTINMFVSNGDYLDLPNLFNDFKTKIEKYGYSTIVNYCADNIDPEYYKKMFIFILEGVLCAKEISDKENEILKYITVCLKIEYSFFNKTQEVIVNKVIRTTI